MFGKILLCIYFMGATQAVFIDPAENRDKAFDEVDSHGWQLIKVYHPPKPRAFGFKHEPYAYPKYEFEYSVSDKKTGDHKHHHEERDGDRVRGEYSLVESDGSLRKVQYHADDHSGFNAVVSKTVNKHGDNAFSVTEHTRYFYPIGHGIKINHYFPGKNYHYQEMEKPEHYKESAPMYEVKESSMAKNEEAKMVVIDAEDKTKAMLLVPEQAKEEPTKINEVETAPIKVIPAVVTMIASNPEESKDNSDNSIIEIENTKSVPTNELPSPIEEQHNVTQKDDQGSDSEVASSYYHSKMYYIAY